MTDISVYFRDESWNRVQALHLDWPPADEFIVYGHLGMLGQSRKAVFCRRFQRYDELMTPIVPVVTIGEALYIVNPRDEGMSAQLNYPGRIVLVAPGDGAPIYVPDKTACTRIVLFPNSPRFPEFANLSITYSRNPKIIPVPAPEQNPDKEVDPSLEVICSP